jgi:hypothetical protein
VVIETDKPQYVVFDKRTLTLLMIEKGYFLEACLNTTAELFQLLAEQ